MIIEKIDPTRESFNDFTLEGAILTVGGVTIDLSLEEGDQQVIIQFGSCQGVVHRGLMPCCEHVADVIIPPRKYQTVEVEGSPQETTRNDMSEEEEPATYTETVPVPLEVESVILRLWPIVDATVSEINQQEKENGSE
jgi:hypothetical protein